MTVVEGQGTEEVSGPALYIERRLRLGEERVVVLVEARQNVHRGVVQLAVVVGGRLPVVGVVITPEASVIVTGEGDLVIKPAPDRDLYSHIRCYITCCSLSKTDPFRQKYRKYSLYSFRILRKKNLYSGCIIVSLYSGCIIVLLYSGCILLKSVRVTCTAAEGCKLKKRRDFPGGYGHITRALHF